MRLVENIAVEVFDPAFFLQMLGGQLELLLFCVQIANLLFDRLVGEPARRIERERVLAERPPVFHPLVEFRPIRRDFSVFADGEDFVPRKAVAADERVHGEAVFQIELEEIVISAFVPFVCVGGL